jgi:hypothetical protein
VIDAGAFPGELCFNLEVRMTTRDVLISIVTLAGLAAPAHATLTYCNSGCSNSNTGVTFTTFGTTAAGLGDTMSSPITFLSGGLSGSPAIYVDAGTGTEFDGFSGTTQNGLTVTGTTLAQTAGSGPTPTSIQVKLPVNTYAFAAFISVVSGGAGPYVELVNSASDFNGGNANYNLFTSAGTGTFFGIVSSTPISSLFIGNVFNNSGAAVEINSFEVGSPADTSTPEVSTFLLIGSGLILMRFLRRRQQRRRQTKQLDPVFS